MVRDAVWAGETDNTALGAPIFDARHEPLKGRANDIRMLYVDRPLGLEWFDIQSRVVRPGFELAQIAAVEDTAPGSAALETLDWLLGGEGDSEVADEEAEEELDAVLPGEEPVSQDPRDEVQFENQLDNEFDEGSVFEGRTKAIEGSNMCNVTTLAIQLKTLASDDKVLQGAAADLLIDKGYGGEREPLLAMQLEDVLMKIFAQLGEAHFRKAVPL
jgi:hypothetical protein